ncbi:MAG: sodium transporter [Sphingobacteriales bacterium 17-39-43]|uniref:sodium/sugar symporter n=1 Tax=Daejeonella sp. TaxID=2805397 RepID=UPI000BC5DEF3|nr:sodium/sugar symporter [Daejeonella sp.]OYZ31547.1 MAG: sodium transporter [Sphingobacteriales bacterium 16-39-50]OZA24647.1 MAG: sodium transporter [Sphingobacteriales bacterium 17-39-43]HQS51473.1 sodium/sugar symporter [Daejeonella sp.]HQT22715.1 sodium/sugar symporter [Daejeonella sp.]HQT57594.1 sodium/sugar symporter [Daejeonella sp.]
MQTPDYIVFFIYFIIVSTYGWYVYKRKKHEDSKDYFLAKDSLTWWAIGASLIASNISAEQFIGMSGSGFTMGLAIAAYEWLAAVTLLVVAVFFIPIYLKNKIYTMPQFLKTRYNETVAMIMAVFWLLLYVVVNLTSILFLGALAISSISGLDFAVCMVGLALFAIIITLGGMNVIGYTDVIQVVFLVLGGLVTTYLALDMVAQHFGSEGPINGFNLLTKNSGDHFQMIFEKDDPYFIDLPGLAVLVGGMWIVNLNYWGCNQYITQRALGADLQTARSGILFAAFLKLLMPIIVVLPGIAAYVLFKENVFRDEMMLNGEVMADRAYPVLLNLLPVGLKGLAFAALTAAVVASLAGKANSIATIFTLDIYKKVLNPVADEKRQVEVGRWVIVISMIMAVVIAPYLGIDKKGGFQYIQEYTGFVSPGILAMFLLGFFWKKATSNAALFATIGGFLLSIIFKFIPDYVDLQFLNSTGFSVANAEGVYEIPFIDRMGFVFMICVLVMYLISIYENRNGIIPNALKVDNSMFRTTPGFAVGALFIIGIIAALYGIYW